MSKKVFISYSWGTKEHQDWVVNLGTRLMSNSVDVVLDQWSLKEGHDVFDFMETMVKSEDIYRVLILCDKNYKSKANDRKGGVGTETLIITPEIYSNQRQEKFIPIVMEVGEDGKPFLPVFLTGRKYLDFSNDELYEDSYEELLRNILEAPSIPKPKLGNIIPSYITHSKFNNTHTNSILRSSENQLKKHPERINTITRDFLDSFSEELWNFKSIKRHENDIDIFGDELINNYKSYKLLREYFLNFFLLSTSHEYDLDIDVLISFFEKKNDYNRPKERVKSWDPSLFEIYKIIFHELFIYTIAICLKNRNHLLVENLLHSKYLFKDDSILRNESKRYSEIYTHHENLENYILKKYSRHTGFGFLIIKNVSELIKKEEIIVADLLCYFIDELFREINYKKWYPLTYVYQERGITDFFEKFSSERHFNKIKGIFEVNTPQELISLINDYKISNEGKERISYGGRGIKTIPFVHDYINPEKIAINR